MKFEELSNLNDEQLLQEAKALKPTKVYDAVLFGVLVGIAIYSTVKNGLGLLSFIPIVYLPIAGRNKKKREAVQKILQERGL